MRNKKEARWKGEGFGDYRCSYCGLVVYERTEECPQCHSNMGVIE